MLCGQIERDGGEWRLTLYEGGVRRPIAVVIGSQAYVELALAAVGLGVLPKDGDRRQGSLVGNEPAHRHTERVR
jgi:hypothetical protein